MSSMFNIRMTDDTKQIYVRRGLFIVRDDQEPNIQIPDLTETDVRVHLSNLYGFSRPKWWQWYRWFQIFRTVVKL